MSNDSAHKHRWETGEFFIGLPYIAGIGLHILFPLTITQGTAAIILQIIGAIFIFIGFVLLIRTRRQFNTNNQPTDPGRPTSKIMTSGPFSISRNPLYLGGIVIFFGMALLINFLWPLLALIISAILCQTFLILPEEKYLEEKFGEEYLVYKSTVRRWIGRKQLTSHWKSID
jgi:protein-S-isoprenylcysteine O-methyltransferase Ste14